MGHFSVPGGHGLTTMPQLTPSSDPLMTFVNSIHDSVGVEQLGARYMATIPALLQASAYGFYLLNVDSHKPDRVATRGAVDRFVQAYEDAGYAYDPVLQRVTETGDPAAESSLFSGDHWQRHPLREVLRMRRLMRILEAPITLGGSTVGILYFTRPPEEAPFSTRDLDVVRLVSAHVRAAAKHALEFTRSEERCTLYKAGLDAASMPLLLSDRAGRLLFANKQAQNLLHHGANSALRSGLLTACLQGNLKELAQSGRGSAVARLPLEQKLGQRAPCLLVRTLGTPDTGDVVASLIYPQDGAPSPDLGYLSDRLPPRELEVLGLVARGKRNKEIATELFITNNTVKYHLKRIFEALGVNSRSELLSKIMAGSRPDEGRQA